MGLRLLQRITLPLAAVCVPFALALGADPTPTPAPAAATPAPAAAATPTPAPAAADFNAQQIAEKFTPSVMLVIGTAADKPGQGVLGTAFVLSEDGIVCTNYHVIDGQDKIVLKSSTGGTFDVTGILATDKKRDIAILKIDAHKLAALKLADSSKLAAGEKVVVIGNPEGLESSITEGIVSGTRVDDEKGPCIQISAAISHGSSGSPVFDAKGKVLGMATFNWGDGQALNFAMPANAIAEVLAIAKNAKPATPDAGPATANLYQPDPKVHGSKAQDTSVFGDPRYAKLKDAENVYDCFAMLSLAKQLVKDYPLSSAASRSLSDAYYYASMPDEAFKAAHRALDLDPDSGRAWNDLATLSYNYTEDGATVAAIYAHAVELAPDDAKLLIEYARGLRATNRGTGQSALNHAKNLLLDDKGQDDETRGYHLYAELVYGYLYLGLNSEAYDTALQFLHKTTSDAWLYLAYAAAAEHANHTTYVIATIEKAMSLDSACKKDALKQEADFYYDQGDMASAINLYKQACTLDSRDFSTISDLVYVISRKPQLAAADYQDLDYYIGQLKSINPKAGKAIEDKIADIIRQNAH